MNNVPNSPESNRSVLLLTIQPDGSIRPEDQKIVEVASADGLKCLLVIGVLHTERVCRVKQGKENKIGIVEYSEKAVDMPLGLLQEIAGVDIRLDKVPPKTAMQKFFSVHSRTRHMITVLFAGLGALAFTVSISDYAPKGLQITQATKSSDPKKERESRTPEEQAVVIYQDVFFGSTYERIKKQFSGQGKDDRHFDWERNELRGERSLLIGQPALSPFQQELLIELKIQGKERKNDALIQLANEIEHEFLHPTPPLKPGRFPAKEK